MILIDGCKNEKTCTEYMQHYVRANLHFYKVYKKGSRLYVEDSTLTAVYFETENYTYVAKNSPKISLPLTQHDDSCTFIVRINSQPSDEIIFKYKRNRIFVNYECGFRTDFTLDSVVSLGNEIDSIQIVNPEVSVNEENNIKIFFNRSDSITH
jgi:hypothetical protein